MRIHRLLALAAFALLVSTSAAEEARVWTSRTNGQQFTGTFVSETGDSVSIRRSADQVVFQVKKEALIQTDLDWIQQQTAQPSTTGPLEDLSPLIASIPATTGVPAVAALLIKDGKTVGLGASGIRKAGDTEPVTPDDKWHLGSCTKSMTATLAATLVEDGLITWDTPLSAILGGKVKMLKDYEPVTLGLLLANRGGVPGKVPESVYAAVDTRAQVPDLKDRDLLKQRAAYVEAVLALPPSQPPGTAYEYSNAGFVVAAAMLEQVTGQPWEKLIVDRLFRPLGMTFAGFGNAAHDDTTKPSQPWPHQNGNTPIPPTAMDDNPWVIGPAGTVHCSLPDIARYLSMHATRELGPVLKKKESFEFLHTAVPANNDYARGWIVTGTPWSNGPAISHDGSNTMNHCSFWVAPEAGIAVAAFTNCGDQGSEACRATIQAIVEKHLK